MKCRNNKTCNICCYVCPKYNDCREPHYNVDGDCDKEHNFSYQDCCFYLDVNNIKIAKVEGEGNL